MDAAALVAEALMKYGPKYAKISKETGVPTATVRYILTKRFPKLGLSVKAAINCGLLGLQRYLVMIEPALSPKFTSRLLNVFGEFMYLTYYTYLTRQGKFMTIFTLPPKYFNSLVKFLNRLKSTNIITGFEIDKLFYMRALPFRVDCFDFRQGVWKQDWIGRDSSIPEIYELPADNLDISKIDLLILKELRKNVFIKYIDLAKILRLTRQTVRKHFEKAVRAIYMYVISWVPPWNPETIATPVIAISHDVEKARHVLINMPYSFTEMRTANRYIIFSLIPSIDFYRTIKYVNIRAAISDIDFPDMDNTLSFGIHPNLYNDRSGWLNPFEIGVKKILEKVGCHGY